MTSYKGGTLASTLDQCKNVSYRKRPCISRTFFHKIEAKNRGCGLSMDTSAGLQISAGHRTFVRRMLSLTGHVDWALQL